ncbi:repressor activator protein 1 [Trypanosoma equiperdum]|uniref:Repressor activator protein 1 n=1 Tax=Trypanosoma equiperdum TaxID=5694 RepID=A0A1G4I737_TRYEQ|nr:repressor activator protein 1 [Trypanosoma equiperdum]
MTDVDGGSGASWKRLRFFVCADTLLTFQPVDSSHLEGRPGQPEQRYLLVDGEYRPITSYPTSSLFLETLKLAGSTVVVIAPWKRAKTKKLLSLFGWTTFDEIRSIHPEPGREKLHLACIGCSADEYSTSVIVTTSRADWSPSMYPQLVEVKHGVNQVPHSLALLRALSSCLRLAEWQVRLPHVPISSCATLCRSRLFSHCRFFLEPVVSEDTTVALSINEHGGYIVTRREDATHCVVSGSLPNLPGDISNLPPGGCAAKAVKECSVLPTSAEGRSAEPKSAKVDTDSVSLVKNQVDESDDSIKDEFSYSAGNAATAMVECGDEGVWNEENADDEDPVTMIPPGTFSEDDEDDAPGGLEEADGETVITVTTQWLKDCAEGLFMYPPQVSHTSKDGSDWNITGLLLATILPTSDAEPLLLSSFNTFAERSGFEPLQLNSADEGGLAEVMQRQWGGVLCMEEKDGDFLLSQTNIYTEAFSDEMDKHLTFVANRFCEAWKDAVQRRRALLGNDAGTQTTVPITVTFGTNTEVEVAPSVQPPPPPPPAPQPTTASAAANEVSKESATPALPFLMRALGPAEWAKEVEAPRSPPPSAVPDIPLKQDPVPSGEGVATAENSVGNDQKESTSRQVAGDAGDTANVAEATEEIAALDQPFEKCFIPTEALGSDREGLDRTQLERQLPFRNYPIKLNVSKSGIFCQFPTVSDAKRFYEEGTVEILNRSLPIKPVFEKRNETVAPAERKRRRSVSPGGVHPQTAAVSALSRRGIQGATYARTQRSRTDNGWKAEGDRNPFVLTEEENSLLTSLGITYTYALENVPLLEHYAQKDLSSKVYRKEKGVLVKMLEKLKAVKGTTSKAPQ